MPEIFKDSIEIATVLEIFAVLQENCENSEFFEFMKDFVKGLTKIKRFDIAVSFLLGKEKVIISKLLETLREKQSISETEYNELTLLYKLRK